MTSSNAQEWQQANLLTLHYSLVSVLVLLAPGTIKSSHAWTWVWLLLAQAGQSIRAGKTHKGVVCGVTSTHCCKSSSSWVLFLLFLYYKVLCVQSCTIVRVFSVEVSDVLPFSWKELFAFSFFAENIAFSLSIHDMQSLVMMINVSTSQLNQQFIFCLAMLIYQRNLTFLKMCKK